MRHFRFNEFKGGLFSYVCDKTVFLGKNLSKIKKAQNVIASALFLLIIISCSKKEIQTFYPCHKEYSYYQMLDTLYYSPPLSHYVGFPVFLSQDTTLKLSFSMLHQICIPDELWQFTLYNSDSVSILTKNPSGNRCMQSLSTNDFISSNLLEQEKYNYYIFQWGCYGGIHCNTFADTSFLGLKIKRSGNTYYGWIRAVIDNDSYIKTVRFIDCCYTNCPDDSIRVGQVKIDF